MWFLRSERGQTFGISAKNHIILPDFMTFNSLWRYSLKTPRKNFEFGISGLEFWYIHIYFGKSAMPPLAVKHEQTRTKIRRWVFHICEN